jgi:phospholipid-transporting ATPase
MYYDSPLILGPMLTSGSMEQFQKAIRKVRQVQRMRKQRGYAFSQTDESQARVLQAYDTTRERDRYGHMASSRR